MTKKFPINCDMGESYGRYSIVDEAAIMPHIDACNIACGFHAGDPVVIDKTVKLAIKEGVLIGAHPSYPDLQGFGRREMVIPPDDLEAIIRYQICALIGIAQSNGGLVHHIKAHGALYNKASKDHSTATAIAKAIKNVSTDLIIFAPYNSIQSEIASDYGLTVHHEAFIDRAYNFDGSLVSRSLKGAVINDPEIALKQIESIHYNQQTSTIDGKQLKIKADTFCIHGDNPAALSILEHINRER